MYTMARRNSGTSTNRLIPIALTIAGSDSSGGAGIQADLKTFSALGVYGCSVITALTAQNTHGVQGIFEVDPGFIKKQLDSVLSDLDVIAVKVGMLQNSQVVSVVADAMNKYQPQYLVVDPVIQSSKGDQLLQNDAIETLKRELIPKANLITPNIHEAALLLGPSYKTPETQEEMFDMMKPLTELGSKAVLLKGGHLIGEDVVDYYYDHSKEKPEDIIKRPIKTKNTHGTGCTLSSAITAFLAHGYTMDNSVEEGKEYISRAIANADKLQVGKGEHGPVHHFWKQESIG